MGLLSAVLAAIVVATVATAVWLACNQRRVQSALTRASDAVQRPLDALVGRLGEGRNNWAATLFDGPAVAVLTVGLTTLCVLSALLAYVSDSVEEYDGITVLDEPVVAWVAAHREPVLTTVMHALSVAASPVAVAALALLVCAAAAWRSHSWVPLATAGIGLAGFTMALITVKLEVARQRPPHPYAVMAVDGYSFPSGHALGVTTATLIAAWALARWLIRSWGGRIAVWTTAVALIGGVGFSRVYLGVHYPSDVIAGWLLGAIWTGALLTGTGLWVRVRRRRPTAPPASARGRPGN